MFHGKKRECLFCYKTHSSSDCEEVKEHPERRTYLKDNKLCLNCGISGHQARERVKQGCTVCKKKHHTSLRDDSHGVTECSPQGVTECSPQGEAALALVHLKSTTKFIGVLNMGSSRNYISHTLSKALKT